jgi:hypothetical protein
VLRTLGIDARRPKEQIEMLIEPLSNGIEAAGTGHLEVSFVARTQADIVDQLVSAPVFREQISPAGDSKIAQLLNSGTVIDSSGRDRLLEFKRLPFEIKHSKQQRHGILTITTG